MTQSTVTRRIPPDDSGTGSFGVNLDDVLDDDIKAGLPVIIYARWVLVIAGLLLSGTVAASVKVAALNTLAVALARVSGIWSVFALILLIAAGTLGGGFHLSSENAGTAVFLGLLSLTGLSALLWPHRQGTAAGS